MKFIIERSQLVKSISIVQKAIASRTTLPVLTGILIETAEESLILTGTDLELGIRTKIPATIYQEGRVVINARIFGDIIRKLPGDEVEITIEENYHVNIISDFSNFTIVGSPADDYPQLPTLEDFQSFSIQTDLLKNMVRQTIFATANDETRPILTGELLEVENGELSMVALDAYRLAYKHAVVDSQDQIKVVIPSKTLQEVVKILGDDGESVLIQASSHHVRFELDETEVISRVLDGQFLNYKDIIQGDHKLRIKVNTRLFRDSIERASLLARESRNNLVKLDISDKGMWIRSTSELGHVEECLPIELEGDDLLIAFSTKYLLDGLKAIDQDEIYMHFVSNVNPGIIRPVNDDWYTYLVLPVRIAD